jgi:L-lactate dehydrogenase complex protein LldG
MSDEDARAAILRRVEEALADHPVPPPVPRAYRSTTPAGVDVLGLFAERVADYRADVRRVHPAGLPAAIAEALAAIPARRVVVPAGAPPMPRPRLGSRPSPTTRRSRTPRSTRSTPS